MFPWVDSTRSFRWWFSRPAYPCYYRFLNGHGVDQVDPCHPYGSESRIRHRGVGVEAALHLPPLTVPSGKVLRQGLRSPEAEFHFV